MQIFLSAFDDVPDPRASNARHDLEELLVIAFVSVLCGSASCAELAAFRQRVSQIRQGYLAASSNKTSCKKTKVFWRLLLSERHTPPLKL